MSRWVLNGYYGIWSDRPDLIFENSALTNGRILDRGIQDTTFWYIEMVKEHEQDIPVPHKQSDEGQTRVNSSTYQERIDIPDIDSPQLLKFVRIPPWASLLFHDLHWLLVDCSFFCSLGMRIIALIFGITIALKCICLKTPISLLRLD